MIQFFNKQKESSCAQDEEVSAVLSVKYKKAMHSLNLETLVDSIHEIPCKNSEMSKKVDALSEIIEQVSVILEYERISSKCKDKRISRTVEDAALALFGMIGDNFNEQYHCLDTYFFWQQDKLKIADLEKAIYHRKNLSDLICLYSELKHAAGHDSRIVSIAAKNQHIRAMDSYGKTESELKPVLEQLNLLLCRYADLPFSSKQDFFRFVDEVKKTKKQYAEIVKQNRPLQLLSYHTPFEFKEQFKDLHPLEKEIKKMSTDHEAVNEYKNYVLKDIELINSVFSQLEQLLCVEEPEKFSLDDISRISKAGQTNFQQDSHLEAGYPMFLGTVSNDRIIGSGLLADKKNKLKNKINNALIEELCDLSNNLSVCLPKLPEEIPAYLHSLDLMPIAGLLEKFRVLGNIQYVAKCEELKSRIKQEKKYFSEVLSVNSQLVQDCGRILESVENANSLLSKIQNKGIDETALVNVRNLVNSGFDSGKYAKYSDDPYLKQAVKKYGETAKEYGSARDSLFETALHKINADVDDLKGADIARVDHALSLFEILSNVKEPSQKIKEKISQLEELRDELKKEQQKKPSPEYLQAVPVYSPATRSAEYSSFELSDFLAAVKQPEDKGIGKIGLILQGKTGACSWNDRFKSIVDTVSCLEPTNNLTDISYLKALSSALKESLAEGKLGNATRCYGISERLIRETIDRLREYTGLSEQRILARAA